VSGMQSLTAAAAKLRLGACHDRRCEEPDYELRSVSNLFEGAALGIKPPYFRSEQRHCTSAKGFVNTKYQNVLASFINPQFAARKPAGFQRNYLPSPQYLGASRGTILRPPVSMRLLSSPAKFIRVR